MTPRRHVTVVLALPKRYRSFWVHVLALFEGLIPTSSFLMASPLLSILPSSKDAHMTNDNLCHASSVLQTENESSNCV
ncbi:hypothetical protein EV424DRAFT_1413379 [Suillus variegatus]|nr:hypothetical protein EV424DRAFT_1413379 [Suillus variegatus]